MSTVIDTIVDYIIKYAETRFSNSDMGADICVLSNRVILDPKRDYDYCVLQLCIDNKHDLGLRFDLERFGNSSLRKGSQRNFISSESRIYRLINLHNVYSMGAFRFGEVISSYVPYDNHYIKNIDYIRLDVDSYSIYQMLGHKYTATYDSPDLLNSICRNVDYVFDFAEASIRDADSNIEC
jgi:hypothetical protein